MKPLRCPRCRKPTVNLRPNEMHDWCAGLAFKEREAKELQVIKRRCMFRLINSPKEKTTT